MAPDTQLDCNKDATQWSTKHDVRRAARRLELRRQPVRADYSAAPNMPFDDIARDSAVWQAARSSGTPSLVLTPRKLSRPGKSSSGSNVDLTA
jgi:hypothetical protein